MFHRVLNDACVAFGLPSSYRMRGTALTAAELRAIVRVCGPIVPLAEVERAIQTGGRLPQGSVLTFDDGYREHLDQVVPLLAQEGHSATFYVTTGLHGQGMEVAVVDAWYWLLDHAQRPVGKVPLPDGTPFVGKLDSLEAKTAWVSGAPKRALLAADRAHQAVMLGALGQSVGVELPADLARRLYLTPDEWGALARQGMRVGAHSVGHPRLTQIAPSEMRREVRDSVDTIGELGDPVAFAYPDGCHDEAVAREVLEAGASSAVTCQPGNVVSTASPMLLPRWFVTPKVVREALAASNP